MVVQADELLTLGTVVVAPTSTRAQPAPFRPELLVGDVPTRLLVDQLAAVDPQRLGNPAGRLDAAELRAVDEALMLLLGL